MECEWCNKEHEGLYASGRFCNKACASKFSSGDEEKRKKKNLKISTSLKGKTFSRKRNKVSKQGIENLRQGQLKRHAKRIKNTPFEKLSKEQQKKRLLEENGHRCDLCGQNEIWNKKELKLELHHKDANRKNKIKENCEIVCPNCHSQTTNFRFIGRKHDKESANQYSLKN